MTIFDTFAKEGRLYIVSNRTLSRIVLNPQAPVFLSFAFCFGLDVV